NVLERAILISANRETIASNDLPQSMVGAPSPVPVIEKQKLTQDTLRLDNMERDHIQRVLEYAEGNKSKAARLLGISRKKLYQKIEADS
ncbi:MAG: helix-turn-helix domain-containing protein, partial [Deltaproteobacteria bacterium]